MGRRYGRIPVNKARFSLMPAGLDARRKHDAHDIDPDLADLDAVYEFCYHTIFDRKPKTKMGQNKTFITSNIRASGVSVKMFFLANMLGWQLSHDREAFYPSALTGDPAVDRVKKYSKLCHERFGAFDLISLDAMLGTETAKRDLEHRILHSEITAGAWIVGYKTVHSGEPYEALYSDKETDLDPYWLAIEGTYFELILQQHLEKPFGTDTQNRHRFKASQAVAKLKRSPCLAVAVFNARERIMPEAISRVLNLRNLSPDDFEMENRPIVHPLKLWSRIGLATQQFECLKFVDNIPSALSQLALSEQTGSLPDK